MFKTLQLFTFLVQSIIFQRFPFSIVASPETILGAQTFGEYQAIVQWNENGLNCNKITQFEQLVNQNVQLQCRLTYSAQDVVMYDINNNASSFMEACISGAHKVLQEKKTSCHYVVCKNSGDMVGSIVSSISCHTLDPQWSHIVVPRNCIQTAINSCAARALRSIEEKVRIGECGNNWSSLQNHMDNVQHLCNSMVKSYVS